MNLYGIMQQTLINEPYTHAHTGLHRSPGSRLATQCCDMEALNRCEEEIPEEEGKAELDYPSTGMVESLKL